MLRERVLEALENNRGVPVSGQELAEKCGVSRAAVWKVIEALKKDGYPILSVRSSGYVLEQNSDVLSEAAVRAALKGVLPDMEIRVFREIDSTNNEAKRMLASGYSGRALLAADRQTAGRGRLGKSFYSPAGSGLYFSLIMKPASDSEHLPMTTLQAGVAAVRAVRKITGKELSLKWVNDLFLDGKKVGGILTEAVTDLESGAVSDIVLGIGINISTESFPADIGQSVGIIGAGCIRSMLCAEIASQFFSIDPSDPSSYMEEYRRCSLVLGRDVSYHGETVRALSIDETGGLEIMYENGTRKIIRGGEIKLPEQ